MNVIKRVYLIFRKFEENHDLTSVRQLIKDEGGRVELGLLGVICKAVAVSNLWNNFLIPIRAVLEFVTVLFNKISKL